MLKYKSPGISIREMEWKYEPSLSQLTYDQILDYLPLEEIERYLRKKKLKNINK